MKAINNKVVGYKGIEVPYTVMLTEDYTKNWLFSCQVLDIQQKARFSISQKKFS
ncbi:hypothetical protein [Planococcus halocryophilus]|uniref:hypothetical protein n=1 Tax=Planococcus halocryophilus TaxID=1215089 RepID=UPI001F2BA082|nr:hypothetical protein [Planococcus halocryophilus]